VSNGTQPTARVAPVTTPTTVARAAGLQTIPFPARSANPFTGPAAVQGKLQRALDAAIAAGPGTSWRAPISVVALSNRDGSGPPCVQASFRPDENHYTASLAKVLAMYAAFQLRETLRAIAMELGPKATAATLIPEARKYLDPLIMAQAGPILAQATLDPRSPQPVLLKHKLPSYTGFEAVAAGAGFTVNFTTAYKNSLGQMIGASSDPDAEICIHNIGYGYLNGALTSAGFFVPATHNGLWLAADYSFFQHWGALTIDTVNDGKASAVCTVAQLAKLFTLLFLFGGLLYTGSAKDQPDPANATATANGRCRTEIFALLSKAGNWMSGATIPLGFTVLGSKLGLGNLKTGAQVLSETAFIQHTASGRRFVVAWQNFVEGADGVDPVARVIDRTLTAFLHP
jgi:hypothetical protein